MRKALTRAAHVLAAAGALGLAGPALAQQTPAAAKPTGSSIVRTGAHSLTQDTEAAPTSARKLEELQVEVALLANPATFAYALGVRHTGSSLELRGFVPDKYVQEQALETARKHCGIPVVDKLQLNSSLAMRAPSASADELEQGAVALLAEGFGKTAASLDLKVVGPGRLAVHGSCESYEQMVEVSKKLRALNGCCVVDNQLHVKPVLRDGQLVTLVTADGSYTVPLASAEAVTAPRQVLADSVLPPVPPMVKPTPPALTSMAPKPNPMDRPPFKTELPPLAAVKPDLTPPVVKKPDAVTPRPPLKADALPALAMKSDVPALPLPPPLPPLKPLPHITPSVTPVAATVTTPSTPTVMAATLPPVAAPVAPATAPASPLANVSAYAKQPGNGWEAKTPAVEHVPPPLVVKPTPPPGGWPTAYETHPTIQVAYATKGVVLFDDDLPEPAPVLNLDKSALLKQKVAAACGAGAKEVVVETKADGILHVYVKTAAQSENQTLTTKILMMPEMASPNVKLHVELGK